MNYTVSQLRATLKRWEANDDVPGICYDLLLAMIEDRVELATLVDALVEATS